MDWIIFAILSAVFASLVAIFGKIGITGVDSTLATSIRAIIMAGFLTIISLISGKFKLFQGISSKALTFILLSGLAGAISWLFYFVALKRGPASSVAALDRLSVVLVFILAIFFLHEQATWKSVLGGVLITLGAILMTIK